MNVLTFFTLALFSFASTLYAEDKAEYWQNHSHDICTFKTSMYPSSTASFHHIPDSAIADLANRLKDSDLLTSLCILNTLWNMNRFIAKKSILSEQLRRKQKGAMSNVEYKELKIENGRFHHHENTLGRCLLFGENFVARTQNDIEPFLKKMKPCGKLVFPEVDFAKEMILFQAGGGNNAKHEKRLVLSKDRKHLLFEVLPIVEMQLASSSDVRYYAISIAQLPSDVKVEFKVHKGIVDLVSSEKIFEDCNKSNCANR